MLDIKGFDKNKIPLLLLPIAGLFLVLFVFMEDKPVGEISPKKEAQENIDYSVEERENLSDENETRLDLYRNRDNNKIKTSEIITDDDFYDLEGDEHHNYENKSPEENNDNYTIDTDKEQASEVNQKERVKYVYKTPENKDKTTTSTVELKEAIETPQKRTRERNSLISDRAINETSSRESEVISKGFIDNDNKLVKSGYDVGILISKSFMVNGVTIPQNTYTTGKATLGKGRVYIKIAVIEVKGRYVTANLEVHEPDGTRGLKVHTGSNQEIKEDIQDEILDQASATVNVPVVGSVNLGSAGRKKDEKGVVLLDRHSIILK